MGILTNAVRETLRHAEAEVFFVPREATKWWNAQRARKDDEVALLGGWYWSFGLQEAGPFRTQTAAWRDVYYRRILGRAPPVISPRDIARMRREDIKRVGAKSRAVVAARLSKQRERHYASA